MVMDLDAVRQIRQRNAALEWWAHVMVQHPHGVIPVSTVSRVLTVHPNRIRELIEDGRFTVVQGMPGGGSHDRFLPFSQLLNAPFRGNSGRPGVHKDRLTERGKRARSGGHIRG